MCAVLGFLVIYDVERKSICVQVGRVLKDDNPAKEAPDRNTPLVHTQISSCFRNKTLHVAGNSISRGIYFSLYALLEQQRDAAELPKSASLANLTNLTWTDREYQKKLCQKDECWPPKPACTAVVNNTAIHLVNTWTQQIHNLVEHLNMTFRAYTPDYTVIQIGLDHVAEGNRDEWKVALDMTWPTLSGLVRNYYKKKPESHLLLTPVYHFNETLNHNKKMSNKLVDTWNQDLKQRIKDDGWWSEAWFSWHEYTSHFVDQALLGVNGLQMDDWVHPNSVTMAEITMDIMAALCRPLKHL